MLSTLHIHLLGQFHVQTGHAAITTLDTPRLQSLLAYLALHPDGVHTRQHLAYQLWPDSSETQARTNLRKQLLFLRRAFPNAESYLHIDNQSIHWQPQIQLSVDVIQFEQELAQTNGSSDDQALDRLREAVDLYHGPLLPGCYDEWILAKRQALQVQCLAVLERLVLALEDQRDYPGAIQYAHRLLEHDTLHEATYRRLMRFYALNGNRAAALETYQTLTALLLRELDVEPGAETQEAYDRLLRNQTPPVLRTMPPLTPDEQASLFVGRRHEWTVLRDIWRTVRRGQAHLVLVAGEPGIGKSRLLEEFQGWAVAQNIHIAHSRCYAAEGRLAYAPLVEWLSTPIIRSRLSALDDVWLVELLRLLPDLRADFPHLPRPEPVTAVWHRRHLFEALSRAFLAVAEPLLLVIDDLQWCDQESLEWLHFFLRFASQAPVLLAGSVRPAEVARDHPLTTLTRSLRTSRQMTDIELQPLSADETAELAGQMMGHRLSAAEQTRFYRETEGNPLFVVESVRAGIGPNADGNRDAWTTLDALHDIEGLLALVDKAASVRIAPGSAAPAVPPKVQAVIEARLDQLSNAAQELAGVASIIGREFDLEVLLRSTQQEDRVVAGLDELLQRKIVREHRAGTYDFTHDKIREVAYAGLSTARRRMLHQRVAQALEAVYAPDLDRVAGRLAAHYEQANQPQQAVIYYQQAATTAMKIHANGEAITLFGRGLALLHTFPAARRRDEKELEFLLGLGPALIAAGGYGTMNVWEVYHRVQELSSALDIPANPSIHRALETWHVARSEMPAALEQAQMLLALAQDETRAPDPLLYVESQFALGSAYFWMGNFAASRQHFGQGYAAYDPRLQKEHIARFWQDPGPICLSREGFSLWYLGYPDQALEASDQAVALARRLNHPLTVTYTVTFALWLHLDRRDLATAGKLTARLIDYCREFDMEHWQPIALAAQGMADAYRGDDAAGLKGMQTAIQVHRAVHNNIYRPFLLARLAEVHMIAGRTDAALAAVDEALVAVQRKGDHWYDPELLRLKGEVRQQHAAPNSIIERLFQQALVLAREQQAKLHELRVATSLARFWTDQGRTAEARQLLAPVYDWFTEGFESADLQDARQLLDKLG